MQTRLRIVLSVLCAISPGPGRGRRFIPGSAALDGSRGDPLRSDHVQESSTCSGSPRRRPAKGPSSLRTRNTPHPGRRHPDPSQQAINLRSSSRLIEPGGIFAFQRGPHMKNTLKRDAKAKGGGEGGVVVLSSGRFASAGKPAGNGARKGDSPAAAAARLAAPRAAETAPASLPEKRLAVRRSLRAAAKARARRGTRRMSPEKVIRQSQRWLDIIARADRLPLARRKRVVKETVKSFNAYFNSGFLEYRKAVAEAEQYAAIEWTGQGSYIEDIMGRQYIDCLGGALAELLGEIAPGNLQKCFFINNGTDAVEGAMIHARPYTEKSGFISTIRGFHGKSYGSLSLMGKAEFRVAFEPLLQDVYFVEFGDADEVEWQLKKARDVGLDIAAVVAEPVQGEAGAIVPPDDYWPRLREICDAYDVLLIADEVQTGMGRTGKLFGVEHWDVIPDIMCLGKALGGGVMPLSAFISTPEIWKVLEKNPFLHSSTFGGNPLACAAGIAAINVTLSEDLPSQAAESGDYFLAGLRDLQARYSDVIV